MAFPFPLRSCAFVAVPLVWFPVNSWGILASISVFTEQSIWRMRDWDYGCARSREFFDPHKTQLSIFLIASALISHSRSSRFLLRVPLLLHWHPLITFFKPKKLKIPLFTVSRLEFVASKVQTIWCCVAQFWYFIVRYRWKITHRWMKLKPRRV